MIVCAGLVYFLSLVLGRLRRSGGVDPDA